MSFNVFKETQINLNNVMNSYIYSLKETGAKLYLFLLWWYTYLLYLFNIYLVPANCTFFKRLFFFIVAIEKKI